MREGRGFLRFSSSVAQAVSKGVILATIVFLVAVLEVCANAQIACADDGLLVATDVQPEEPAEQQAEVVSFRIIFEKNGGTSSLDEMEATYGSGQTLPGDSITKTGNTLTGWALTSNGADETYEPNASIDEVVDKYGSQFANGSTITIKAMWELNSYKVSFYDYNNSLLAEQMVQYGYSANYYEAYRSFTDADSSYAYEKCQFEGAYDFSPAEYGPTRSGYVFIGWDKSTENIKCDMKLTARYLSLSEAKKVDGVYSAIEKYFPFYSDGLYFRDDYGEDERLKDASGRALYGTDIADQIDEILKQYNSLAKDSRRYCDANDIKELQTARAHIDSFVAAQKRDVAVGKMYTIKGVKYKITTSRIGEGGTVRVCAPAKKSAKKIVIPKSVKISGNTFSVTEVASRAFANCSKLQSLEIGGSVKKIGTNAFYGTKILVKLAFKRSMAKTSFAKKALNQVGKTKGKGLKVTIPKLSAKYAAKMHKAGLSKHAAVNGYKFTKINVSFSANGGKLKGAKSKKVVNFKKYGKLPSVSRSGYKFEGWYTKKNGGNKVSAGSIVKLKKGMKLYAHWFGPKGSGRTITKAEYGRIDYGMTYSQVKYLIGGACHDSYSYTDKEYVEDSHEEWVDTSYEEWVYDEYDEEDYGHYETVQDGYWNTVDDSYFVDHDIVNRTWYGSKSGFVTLVFRDGYLDEINRYGL